MMRSGGRNLQRSLGVRLTADLREIEQRLRRWPVARYRSRRLHRGAFLPVPFQIAEMTDPDNRRRGADLRLGDVADGYIKPSYAQSVEVSGDGQRSPDG